MNLKLKYLKLDVSLIGLVFKNCLKNSRNYYYTCKHKVVQGKLEQLIESFSKVITKDSQKLSSICISSKSSSLISNLKEKSKVFNKHFPKQLLDTK